LIERLAIIGVGLIGSSLALALREANYVGNIIGFGRNRQNLQRGIELGVLDEVADSIADAVTSADMVLVAVPLGAMGAVFGELANDVSAQATITDVGSAKRSVIEQARKRLGPKLKQFVPGHPIAGTERSGVEAGFAELYRGRKVILTPLDENSEDAIDKVSEMWQAAGAGVELMGIEHHDRVLAATSHLPHMLAFSLVSHLSKMSEQEEIFAYAAGGFRDFTRIAASDPVMWRDFCLANSDALLQVIAGFQSELQLVEEAIRRQDANALQELFHDAKHTREQLRDL
jgi:prephenate dehydrogenase